MTRRDAEHIPRHTAQGLGRFGGGTIEDIGPPFSDDPPDQATHPEHIGQQLGPLRGAPGGVRYVGWLRGWCEKRAARVVADIPECLNEGVVYPLTTAGPGVMGGEVLYEEEAHVGGT